MTIYLPSSLNANDVICVNTNTNDNVYLTLSNGINYELKYNNTIGDYTIKQLETLDVSCENINVSNDVFYRKDLDSILICFFILVIICLYFPYRIIVRCLGKWLKL